MTYVGNLTLTEDEAFGDYHKAIPQKSTRYEQAIVENYDKTGGYIFVKLFKKNTDGVFTLEQKIDFTQEEFEKLIATGKPIS